MTTKRYDKTTNTYFSIQKRNELLQDSSIKTVPKVGEGKFTEQQLVNIINTRQSHFYDGPMEGVYLRIEEGEKLKARGKIVRSDFLGEGDGEVVHWSKKELVKNIVLF